MDATTDIFVDGAGYTWLIPGNSSPFAAPSVLMQNGSSVGGLATPFENRWYPLSIFVPITAPIAIAAGPLPGVNHPGGWFISQDHAIWRNVR